MPDEVIGYFVSFEMGFFNYDDAMLFNVIGLMYFVD